MAKSFYNRRHLQPLHINRDSKIRADTVNSRDTPQLNKFDSCVRICWSHCSKSAKDLQCPEHTCQTGFTGSAVMAAGFANHSN